MLVYLPIFLAALVILFIGFSIYKRNNLQIQTTLPNLAHFKNNTVPLQFDYPSDFPLTEARPEQLNGDSIEEINFSETYLPNSSDDSYGYIFVIRKDVPDLHIYLSGYYKNQVGADSVIENVSLKHVSGYRVHIIPDPKEGDSLGTAAEWTYYFYEDGFLYQIALTNPSYKNSDPNEIKNIFENIILQSLQLSK